MKDLVKKFEDAKVRIAKLKLYREAGERSSKRGSLDTHDNTGYKTNDGSRDRQRND
jgi:hypothetical protein